MSALPIVVDFETEPIEPRPHYPPKPVSVAIWEGRKPEFWAWGHPEGNTCTKGQARCRLREVWRSKRGLLFHHAAFDLDVAETHLGLRPPPWHRIHDTVVALFLADPNAEALSLKPAAEHYLGWPQEDQDPIREWILEHVPEARRRPSQWEAWISRLPGHLAAERALGDVRRTRALWELAYEPSEPYDRERRLIPVLLAMERRGVPVDARRLAEAHEAGTRGLEAVEKWLRRRLRAPDWANLQSAQDLADCMEKAPARAGRVPRGTSDYLVDEWLETPTGKRATGWEALREVCKDPVVPDVIHLRGMLQAQVRTFAGPWLEQARETGGRVYVRFNAVKSASATKRRQVGARTGRLSSEPNLMNVPEAQPRLCRTEREYRQAAKEGAALRCPIPEVVLPDLRLTVAAPRGMRMGGHDYSQQELRNLAHFADGGLADAYRRDPRTDAHGWMGDMLQAAMQRRYPKRIVKNVNFAILYGAGIDRLVSYTELDAAEVRKLRATAKRLLGATALDRSLQAAEQCVTWGGRICPKEPEKLIRGRLRDFGYKLINTLVQGSAADQIKEAIIRVDEHPRIEAELLLSVHDELLWLAPARIARSQVKPITEILEGLPLSVPLVAEGKVGKTWRDVH